MNNRNIKLTLAVLLAAIILVFSGSLVSTSLAENDGNTSTLSEPKVDFGVQPDYQYAQLNIHDFS
jgi:hypothetical protein